MPSLSQRLHCLLPTGALTVTDEAIHGQRARASQPALFGSPSVQSVSERYGHLGSHSISLCTFPYAFSVPTNKRVSIAYLLTDPCTKRGLAPAQLIAISLEHHLMAHQSTLRPPSVAYVCGLFSPLCELTLTQAMLSGDCQQQPDR